MKLKLRTVMLQYKWGLLTLVLLLGIILISPQTGFKASQLTISNFLTMLSVLPPILLLIGLLDVWIPKEVMIKYMGEHSGVKGLVIAFLLGSFAAGPLYAAFPVAAVLLKKRAKLSNVLFFLGVWSTAKLPMVMFEFTSFGGTFTLIHIVTNLAIFLIGAILVDKLTSQEHKEQIYSKASHLAKQ